MEKKFNSEGMIFWLYDPRYNLKQEITFSQLEAMGIMTKSSARSQKSRVKRIKKINKYLVDIDTPISQLKKLYCNEVIENELWRDIEGYDHKYKISNYGRIKKVGLSKEYFLLPYGKTKTKTRNDLRRYIGLYKDGKKKEVIVSNLVAEAFLDKPQDDKDLVVFHLDGRVYNDNADNLSYITKSELGKITGINSYKAVSTLMVDPYNYEIIDSYTSGRLAAKENFISHETVFQSIKLEHLKNLTGNTFIEEDTYYDFMDTLDTKKYILYNSKTKEQDKGTLLELQEKYDLGIHQMRFSYENKRNIPHKKIYIVGCNFKNFDKLK